jgi:hypothetical protein
MMEDLSSFSDDFVCAGSFTTGTENRKRMSLDYGGDDDVASSSLPVDVGEENRVIRRGWLQDSGAMERVNNLVAYFLERSGH